MFDFQDGEHTGDITVRIELAGEHSSCNSECPATVQTRDMSNKKQ